MNNTSFELRAAWILFGILLGVTIFSTVRFNGRRNLTFLILILMFGGLFATFEVAAFWLAHDTRNIVSSLFILIGLASVSGTLRSRGYDLSQATLYSPVIAVLGTQLGLVSLTLGEAGSHLIGGQSHLALTQLQGYIFRSTFMIQSFLDPLKMIGTVGLVIAYSTAVVVNRKS